MRRFLTVVALTLLAVRAFAAAPFSETWLFDPSINVAGPDTCAMVMYNMNNLGATSIEPVGAPSMNYRLTAYTIGRTGSGSAQLQGVAGLPIGLGSDFDSAANFQWSLFLRLNGDAPNTPRPVVGATNWTDCVAANQLVLGMAAYP